MAEQEVSDSTHEQVGGYDSTVVMSSRWSATPNRVVEQISFRPVKGIRLERTFEVTDRIPPPGRTLAALVASFAKMKRKEAQRLIHAGAVSVNGRVVRQPFACLAIGDRVRVEPIEIEAPPPKRAVPDARRPLQIVFHDEHIVVVGKPAGMLTVPSPNREKNTLLGRLQKWAVRRDRDMDVICVHRLDREVSGLLVFALHREAAESLKAQFAVRKPKRLYAAIVAGELKRDHGTVRSRLQTHSRSLKRYSNALDGGGQLAVTHWRVQQRCRIASMVSIQLETGRRHQIRVHMAEMGHPVLGDSRYASGSERAELLWPWKRLALHAAKLEFDHPITGELVRFQSPLPPEFEQFMKAALHPHRSD